MDDVISIPARVCQLVADRPNDVPIRFVNLDGHDHELTWCELDRWSSQLAGAFVQRGVGHGDRVAMAIRNSSQVVIAAHACWKVGAVPVPVRWDIPEWELDRLVEAIDPKLFLGMHDVGWIDSTRSLEVPILPNAASPSTYGICSSGSTGTPKVIVTGRPAVYNPALTTPFMELWRPVPRPQVVLVTSPVYHLNGFAPLLFNLDGDQLVMMEKFDAALAVDAIERFRVSTFVGTPTMLKRITDLPDIDGRDFSSIEYVTQGAAPMPPSLVDRVGELIGLDRLVMAYSMTEGLGMTAVRADEWVERVGTVGRPLTGTEVKILDEDGRDVPPGDVGLIYLRSQVYGGATYLNAPAQPTTEEGFSTVGDLGYVDADGYLYLVDRRVDLIISGGANVYPAEVEIALIDHPQVADVVVVGLKDAEWGRRVHAIVQPRNPEAPPSPDDLRAYARDRLAAYKVPKSIELVDKIPRTEATKVNRGALVAARGG